MKYLFWFSFLIIISYSSRSEAVASRLVFTNESSLWDGTTFTLDTADEAVNVDLKFGNSLTARIQFDTVEDVFKFNRSIDLEGNEVVNARVENLGAAPVCDALSLGRMYISTVDNNSYICNGTAFERINRVATEADVVGQFYDGTGGLNVNVDTAVAVGWDQEVRKDSGITHDNVTNNSRITLDEAGWYEVSYNIAYINGTNGRKTVGCFLQLDGTTQVSGSTSYSYARNNTDNFGSNSATVLFETTSANQYYEVLCQRNGSTGAATLIVDSSGTTVKKLDTGGNGGNSSPYISSEAFSVQPSSSKTLSIEGTNFTPESTVSFPGFPGTVNTITVVSPTQIDVNVTATAAAGTFDIVVSTDDVDNTVWAGNGEDLLVVEVVSGTGSAGTYTESFETDLGSWTNSGLDQNWTRDSGGTPSGGTGPTVASDGTFYLFTETSGNGTGYPNRTFGIETTDFAVAQSIEFDYHMFGTDMGTLEVQTLRDGAWTTRDTLSGQQQGAQGDAYLTRFVDLSTFEVEGIRFFYTSGSNFAGDCTIDNVSIISS